MLITKNHFFLHSFSGAGRARVAGGGTGAGGGTEEQMVVQDEE